MYDPHRPLPKQLDGVPETDEEKALAEDFSRVERVDSGLSDERKVPVDGGREETWPLNPEKSQQVLQIRPSRPWSEIPKQKKSPGVHAL